MNAHPGRYVAAGLQACQRCGPLVAVALLVLFGCSAPQPSSGAGPSTAAASAEPLPPVSLPDLSPMEPTVREQIKAQYQALTALAAAPSTPPADLARAYGAMGSLLLAADEADAAQPCYLHAEALAPAEMRWPYYLGHVYMARADPQRAVAAFERALRLQPNDVATLVWLGNVLLGQGEAQQAEVRFVQALSVQPHTVAALFGSGQAALAQRDYAKAVERFEQVLAADPRATIAHYPLELAYRGLGDTARAEAHLRQQGRVEVGPPDPLMLELRDLLQGSAAEERRGVRALDGGDYKAAVEHFRKGVELAPDNPSIRHKLGTALSLTGDTRGAMEAFQETVRRSPGYAQAHYSLGVLLAANGRIREAIDALTTAVRYEPGYVDARLQLGELLGRSGQYQRALEQYREVLAIGPRVADARFGYAGALVGLRKYREALDSLGESVRLYPDQPRFADARARLEAGLQGGR
jgi:tetratricopeptide (TPR) repeat protein